MPTLAQDYHYHYYFNLSKRLKRSTGRVEVMVIQLQRNARLNKLQREVGRERVREEKMN